MSCASTGNMFCKVILPLLYDCEVLWASRGDESAVRTLANRLEKDAS